MTEQGQGQSETWVGGTESHLTERGGNTRGLLPSIFIGSPARPPLFSLKRKTQDTGPTPPTLCTSNDCIERRRLELSPLFSPSSRRTGVAPRLHPLVPTPTSASLPSSHPPTHSHGYPPALRRLRPHLLRDHKLPHVHTTREWVPPT